MFIVTRFEVRNIEQHDIFWRIYLCDNRYPPSLPNRLTVDHLTSCSYWWRSHLFFILIRYKSRKLKRKKKKKERKGEGGREWGGGENGVRFWNSKRISYKNVTASFPLPSDKAVLGSSVAVRARLCCPHPHPTPALHPLDALPPPPPPPYSSAPSPLHPAPRGHISIDRGLKDERGLAVNQYATETTYTLLDGQTPLSSMMKWFRAILKGMITPLRRELEFVPFRSIFPLA